MTKFGQELALLLLEKDAAVAASTSQPLCTCQAQAALQLPQRPGRSMGREPLEKQTLVSAGSLPQSCYCGSAVTGGDVLVSVPAVPEEGS